jgi:HlyD family secretion protein
MKKLIILVMLTGVLGTIGYWQWQSWGKPRTSYNVAEVKKGRLEATVGSTGTLQPRELVDIGAQVLGRIIFIGKDKNTKSGIVDWGSEVQGPVVGSNDEVIKEGTLLAQIDPSLYEAQRNSAAASVQSAKADVEVKTANLYQATRDWNRAQNLIKTGGIAQAEYDQFKAVFGATTANLALSKSNVALAEANLKTAQTNLNYTRITAPVNGVVIDRRVNVGQTVVASLSAPSLFLIAKDLSQMEVWATVNEVDVGKIHAGQDVRFTVDAFAGKVYHGKVVPQGKLPFRLNATMNQNVVTYTVVVSVNNEAFELTDEKWAPLREAKVPDEVVQKLKVLKDKSFETQEGFVAELKKVLAEKEEASYEEALLKAAKKVGKLSPYLTSNLTFVVADKKNVLLVPNSALRWQPAQEQIAPEIRDSYRKMKGKKRSPNDTESSNHGIVWVQDEDGHVRYIEVQTGLSDSVNTEIVAGELPEGTKVITGEAVSSKISSGANPFVASPFGKKKE